MQSGLGRPAAGARRAGICSQWARAGALLASLAASACANLGQLGNLTEERRIAVTIESVDGPPPEIFRRFMTVLKEEAGARQIAVVPPGEADYRLRGYLATQAEGGGAIAWAWDAYDANQRRALRMGGVERAQGSERDRWAGADDQVLRKIARAGVERFATFAASNNRSQATAVASAPPPPERSRSTFAWLDDWAPEASGIFRIFRREEPRTDASIETALDRPQSRDVPLPKGRPEPSATPSDAPADTTLAFASQER